MGDGQRGKRERLLTEDPYADAWPTKGHGYVLTPTLFLGEPSETLATTHVTDPIEAAVLIMAGARVILDGDDSWVRGRRADAPPRDGCGLDLVSDALCPHRSHPRRCGGDWAV